MTDRDGGAGFVTGLLFGGLLGFAAGILLVTGMFSSVSASLADLGQLINLEF